MGSGFICIKPKYCDILLFVCNFVLFLLLLNTLCLFSKSVKLTDALVLMSQLFFFTLLTASTFLCVGLKLMV